VPETTICHQDRAGSDNVAETTKGIETYLKLKYLLLKESLVHKFTREEEKRSKGQRILSIFQINFNSKRNDFLKSLIQNSSKQLSMTGIVFRC
jgi:hypothetical protein